MQTKTCCRCKRDLPLEAFNHRGGKKRHLLKSWCRECCAAVKRSWQKKHAPEENAKTRAYRAARRDYIRALARQAYWADPEGHRAIASVHSKSHPEENRAHARVHNALAAGKLTRKPCEVCGAKAHAHHDDYSKPLDVRWLCPVHHKMVHGGSLSLLPLNRIEEGAMVEAV